MELWAPLSAKVAEYIGMPVRLLQQLHLPLNQAKALPEEPLDSYCPTLKLSPERWPRGRGSERAHKGKGRTDEHKDQPVHTHGVWENGSPRGSVQKRLQIFCLHSPENKSPTCPTSQHILGVEGNLPHYGELFG